MNILTYLKKIKIKELEYLLDNNIFKYILFLKDDIPGINKCKKMNYY